MKLLSALSVSLVALTMSTASFASEMNKDYSYRPATQAKKIHSTDSEGVKDVKRGLNTADAKMRNAADDIHAFFVDDETTTRKSTRSSNKVESASAMETDSTWRKSSIHRGITAEGMLDEKILTPEGRQIAEIEDIILTKDGTASKVIVSDGGLLGIGDKLAAFDYKRVITQRNDGKVVMALSQDMIDRAAEFSYDSDDYMKSNVIPAGAISVDDLLDGEVYDNRGEKVASIENVSFSNGKADRLIVGLNKKLGMGGDLAALNFSSLNVSQDSDHDVRVDLTEAQSLQLSRIANRVASR